MDSNQISEVYNRMAERYDSIAPSKNYTAYNAISNLLISVIKNKNAKILDLACGTGLGAVNFFNKKFEVTGIDISEGMLEKAQEKPFNKLICQDLEKPLQVENTYYDGAVLIGAMEFIHKPIVLLKRIRAKLKNDGFLALSVPQKTHFTDKYDNYSYSKEEIEEIFIKSGYEIIKTIELFGYYMKNKEIEVHYFGYLLKKLP